MRRQILGIAAVALALLPAIAGCGGSPTAPPTPPPGPSVPTVSGIYSGTITLSYTEQARLFSCPVTTAVNQSGETVSIAPIILSQACSGFTIPIGSAKIDQEGTLVGLPTNTIEQPDCGTYTTSGSGGFLGRELQISITATSATCPDFNFKALLTR